MKNLTKLFIAPALLLCLIVISCTKENQTITPPEDQLVAGEILQKQPSPGIYKIIKFIDTGDDETAQFNGYTFEFQADHDLIVTTANGQTFTGSWSLNSAG